MLGARLRCNMRSVMSLFALIAALILEHFRPLPARTVVDGWFVAIRDLALSRCETGEEPACRMAWALGVVGSGAVVLVVHVVLWRWSPLLAFAFSVAVLYFLIGVRRDESAFAEVERALAVDDEQEAARRLSEWTGRDHSGAGAVETTRLAVEQVVLGGHRGVFAPVFWFVLLPGPVGVVMYRMARELAECADAPEFARQAFQWVDWLPARVSALAFSVIGNFEDAVDCWRSQAALWPDRCAGVVLAAAGGALGVRLGMPVHRDGEVVDRPELGMGSAVDVDTMPRAARLVWRVLVLVVLVLALLAVAGWAGR
jgi:adenosylcobinamide-phosphate synthase